MTDAEREKLFAEHLEEFQSLIAKRRHKWRATSIMEWEDVQSVLMNRVFRQLHHYDNAQPLDRWVNKLISNEIMNLLRNNLFKTARPCIAATSYGSPCTFNTGGDGCSWTPSKRQCGECKFFSKWESRKKSKFAISTPLSIENHTDEYHSAFDETPSAERFEEVRDVVHNNIKRRLTKEEYRVYTLLYVKHLEMDEALKKLGFKKDDQKNYMRVRGMAILIRETAKAIVSEHCLFR